MSDPLAMLRCDRPDELDRSSAGGRHGQDHGQRGGQGMTFTDALRWVLFLIGAVIGCFLMIGVIIVLVFVWPLVLILFLL
jgi:hypothetical protein